MLALIGAFVAYLLISGRFEFYRSLMTSDAAAQTSATSAPGGISAPAPTSAPTAPTAPTVPTTAKT